MKQYIGESKLLTCGFVKEGNKFVLYREQNDKRLGKRRVKVGTVVLDKNGYVEKHSGLPMSNGKLSFYHRW